MFKQGSCDHLYERFGYPVDERLGLDDAQGPFSPNTIQYLLELTFLTHSSVLAWKMLWTEEPGRLQSMGSRRVGHD